MLGALKDTNTYKIELLDDQIEKYNNDMVKYNDDYKEYKKQKDKYFENGNIMNLSDERNDKFYENAPDPPKQPFKPSSVENDIYEEKLNSYT